MRARSIASCAPWPESGIFSEDPQGRFGLTPLADFLRSEHPDTSRSFARMVGSEFYHLWGQLLSSVKTGEDATRITLGSSFFEYMTRNPERHRLYDDCMRAVHDPETAPMLAAYDFSGCETVMDVGGGNGSLLGALLCKHPEVQGILFDLPSVAESARQTMEKLGVSSRCVISPGSFLETVPADADIYLLRHVIHDWQDEDAVTILKNCRKAMKAGSRILIAETVIPAGNGFCFAKWLDLMMLLVNGRERTEPEFRNLFSQAGLKLQRILPTSHEISILEGVIP